jgi:hypothetical protein
MTFVLLLILSAASAAAAADFGEWTYHAGFEAPEAGFAALELSPQNLDRCEKGDLSDLRITDARGVEVPYAVVHDVGRSVETVRVGTVLNREYPDGATSRITVDFGAPVEKNRITVPTEGDSFRRRVKIEGSDTLEGWSTLLPEGWAMAAGAAPERRFEIFDIGLNTYRYLRLSVAKMPEEIGPPEIGRVSFVHRQVVEPVEAAVSGALLEGRIEDGATVIEADFGQRNLSIGRFRLLLGRDPGRIFEKRCVLSGRNSLERAERIRFESGEYGKERMVATPWERLGEGVIRRDVRGERSLDLAVPSRFRYLRIEIENRDGPPLEVAGVTAYAAPVYLVFEPAGQSRLQVHAGNAAAPKPRYESARALGSLDVRTLERIPPVELTGSDRPPERAPEGQRLVWIVLALAVLATAWIFRRTATNVGGEG